MLCPLKFNRDSKMGIKSSDCEKEKCSWWSEKVYRNKVNRTNNFEIEFYCAIKLIAELK